MPTTVPSTTEIIHMHQERGGNLVQEHVFGQDPLEGHEQLKLLRERDFYLHMPSMEELFEKLMCCIKCYCLISHIVPFWLSSSGK